MRKHPTVPTPPNADARSIVAFVLCSALLLAGLLASAVVLDNLTTAHADPVRYSGRPFVLLDASRAPHRITYRDALPVSP